MTRDEFKDLLAVAMHVGRILHFIGKSNRKRWIPVFEPYSVNCGRGQGERFGVAALRLRYRVLPRLVRRVGMARLIKPRA